MTHLFYLLLILSEYFIHDNGDGARHDFLEFLEDVLHGAAFLICHAHYKTFMMFEGGRCAMSSCFI